MADVNTHGHLILHHLHELSERCVFRRFNQMVLPGRILGVVAISIVDHVCDQADFQQVRILRHLAEFESEFLLSRIVEIGAEERGVVGACVLVLGVGSAILLPRCRLFTLGSDLIRVEHEEVNLTHDYLIR